MAGLFLSQDSHGGSVRVLKLPGSDRPDEPGEEDQGDRQTNENEKRNYWHVSEFLPPETGPFGGPVRRAARKENNGNRAQGHQYGADDR